MPLYTFRCPRCGDFDVRRSFADAGAPMTHDCGEEATRVFNTSPIIWRPEGWLLSPSDPMYSRGLREKETRPLCQQ